MPNVQCTNNRLGVLNKTCTVFINAAMPESLPPTDNALRRDFILYSTKQCHGGMLTVLAKSFLIQRIMHVVAMRHDYNQHRCSWIK